MTRLAPIVLVVLGACSTKSAPAGKSSSATPVDAATAAGKTPTAAGPRSILEDGFFRSSRGDIVASWSTRGDAFAIAQSPPGDAEFFFLYEGTRQQYVGQIAVFAFPPKTSVADAFATMAGAATNLGLAPQGPAQTGALPGGAATLQPLAGKLPPANTQAVSGELAVIRDGDATAGVFIFATSDEDETLAALSREMLDGIRVGSKVPKLAAAADPGTPIEGIYNKVPHVYNTPEKFMTFAPGGYVASSAQLAFDPELRYQHAPDDVRSYTVRDGKLWIHGGAQDRSYALTIDARGLLLDHERYERIDGPQCDGLRLDGHYVHQSASMGTTSSEISRDIYDFGRDGTFQSSSTFSGVDIQTITIQQAPTTEEQRQRLDPYDLTPTDVTHVGGGTIASDDGSGTYRIEANQIFLTLRSGRVVTKTFFCTMEGGKVYEGTLTLDGLHYSKR